jgi:biofilm PGA synthesis N-glycosyltransferase PgaC
MIWAFWVAVATVFYAYVGYPVFLCFRQMWKTVPVRSSPIEPLISVVLVVHNEQDKISAKLENLAALNYPKQKMEIVVVSDGSTDGTNQILGARRRERLKVIFTSRHDGKAAALNQGIQAAMGEIVVFADVRQTFEPESIRHLVANFADESVGCVSGELMIGTAKGPAESHGSRIYWDLEKQVRQWESMTSSVVGATGAIYAARKELLVPLPAGTILDDMYIPLHVAKQSKRIVFEPAARAWETVSFDLRREFRRKVRTLTGNYQLLQLAPWLLTSVNPVRFEFISHKLFRLVVPFGLLILLASSALANGAFYRLCFAVQMGFYALAGFGFLRLKAGKVARIANLASTFVVLNTAAVAALLNFVSGKKQVWVR